MHAGEGSREVRIEPCGEPDAGKLMSQYWGSAVNPIACRRVVPGNLQRGGRREGAGKRAHCAWELGGEVGK